LGERIYSIYSGGDDLFFVGSWDAVVELGRRIRADLGRYAGQHPGIHASAGIVLAGGKYPLYQAAQDAGHAEDQAKALQWLGANERWQQKDAVTFLGQAVSWQQFGLEDCTNTAPQTVHALAHRLETALIQKEAPRALLGLLMRFQEKYDTVAREKEDQGTDLNQQRKKQAIWGPWNWQSAYFLRRMQKRSNEQNFKDLLEGILNLLQSDQFASIEWIGLAARWAELKLR
jgi:CRISPR-associated protein Csm1